MSLRAAFCITTLGDGGAERQLVELVTRLPRDQFDPLVIVLSRPPNPPADQLSQSLVQHKIPVDFLGAGHLGHIPRTWRALAERLRTDRPALLQCFLAHANLLGAAVGRRLGIRPIVAGIRVAEQRRNWHNFLTRRTSPWVDKFVCVSRDVADFAARTMRLPREKLVVIPNGIDGARFDHAAPAPGREMGVGAGRRVILFVGRLDRQKRPDWLIERMPAIFRLLPQHDLVVVGDGPLRWTLARQVLQLGVDHRVHFVGRRSDVARYYAAADLLVLTSDWEGMPNVVLEAMAAARPVVATAAHGVVELLDDVAAGQIVPLDEPQAFVAAVVRIASNTDLATRLGTQNRHRVITQFSIDVTVQAYVDLYRTLLDG